MASKINKKGAKINSLLNNMESLEPKVSRETDGFMRAADKNKLDNLPDSEVLQAQFTGKQDVIQDLSTIRSGAAAGGTAYQKPGTGIPESDMSDAVKAKLAKAETALQEHQDISGKQDVIDDLATIRSGAAAGGTAYQKPGTGIPESDMSDGVKAKLAKAESALQEHQDISGKQDVIQDLAAIRSGAAAGGTAYQKPGTGIPASDLSSEVQDMIENGGKTKSVSVNGGTPVTPDANGQVDLTIEQANVTIGNVTTGEEGTNAEVTNSGTPTAPMLNFKIPRGATGATGPKGATGDSAVYDPSSPDTPDFVMANEKGQSTTKAMTQKAVTDAIEDVANFEEVFTPTNEIGKYVYQEKWYNGGTTNTCYLFEVNPGDTFRCENTGNNPSGYHILFLASNTTTPNTTPDYAVGFIPWYTTTQVFVAPASAKYMYVRAKVGGSANATPTIHKITQVKDVVFDAAEKGKRLTAEIFGVKDAMTLCRQIELKDLLLPPREEGTVFLSTTSPFEWASKQESGVWIEGKIVDVSRYRGMTISITYIYLRAAFLTDNNCPWPTPTGSSKVLPHFCSGTTFIRIDVGQETTSEYVIPADAMYLYVQIKNGSGSMGVTSITVGNDISLSEALQNNLMTSYKNDLVGAINSLILDTRKTIDYKLELQAGMFNLSNGLPYTALITQDIFSHVLNRRFLKVKPTDRLNEIEYDSDNEDLTVLYYGSTFQYLGYSTNTVSIPQGTAYMRFMLSVKSGIYDYANRLRTITMSLTYSGDVEVVADGGWYQHNESLPSYRGLMYEVREPLDSDDGITASGFVGSERRAINAGYIYLPKCYQHDGKPCQLIIFGHGTEGFSFTQTDVNTSKWRYIISYLTSMGYAVADCSTFTTLWTKDAYGSQTSQALHDLNPSANLTYACYCSLYKYVTENFNVEKEVYVFGKSAGGMIITMLGYYRPFPIKAVAGLAPSMEIYSNMKILAYSYDINWWMNRLGISDANVPGQHNWTDAQKETLVSYWQKFVGHNPMWLGVTGVDFEAMAHELVYTAFNSSALDGNNTLQTIVSNGRKMMNTPFKIWHAQDDANVPYALSKMFVKMAKNAGCQCYLRTMPNNTGAHSAVDDITGTAISKEVVTLDGETYTMPVAILEMVEWFNRW